LNAFEVGSCIKWLDTPEARVDVVLWIAPNRGNCVYIDTNSKNKSADPVTWSVADIEEALGCCKAKTVPFEAEESAPELQSAPSEKARADGEKAWEIIEPLVSNPEIYDRKARRRLIKEQAKGKHVTRKVTMKYLRLYWQAGSKKSALLPKYDRRGGSTKVRKSSAGIKRGRPNELKVKSGIDFGINVDEEVRRRFRLGIARYYENTSGATLRKAYWETIKWHFNLRVETIDGVDYPILPPVEKRPSFEQFVYWYYRERRLSQAIIARKGENEFLLNHRALDGSPQLDVFGPGSIFELDSTVADVYLVSALDRNRILGRPVLYIVKDAFSRLIVGFGVNLDGPSWTTAMIALENTMRDKVELCREFGKYIQPWQWPSRHLPRAIRADRGELLSQNSDTLINDLDVEIDTTAPYRPDWKGMIEENFHLINGITIHWLPGQPNKIEKRGGKDYRYDACLTLYEFRQIIISSIIQYNTTYVLEDYPKDPDMIADHVLPIPIRLWEWGTRNRSGPLREESRLKVRLALLPRGMASVTPTGIQYKGADYICERAKKDEWLEQARIKRMKVPISYDPRNMDSIFLRLDLPEGKKLLRPDEEDPPKPEVAYLMKKDLRFSGCDWQDVEDYQAVERHARILAGTELGQMQSDEETFRGNVVAVAQEKTADASRGMSHASRVASMTAERRAENNAENAANAWTPPAPTPPPGQVMTREDRYKQEEYAWLRRMRDGEKTDE
jgi:putative transposase